MALRFVWIAETQVPPRSGFQSTRESIGAGIAGRAAEGAGDECLVVVVHGASNERTSRTPRVCERRDSTTFGGGAGEVVCVGVHGRVAVKDYHIIGSFASVLEHLSNFGQNA